MVAVDHWTKSLRYPAQIHLNQKITRVQRQKWYDVEASPAGRHKLFELLNANIYSRILRGPPKSCFY